MILYRVAYQLQNKRYLGCRIFAVELTKTMTKTMKKAKHSKHSCVIPSSARDLSPTFEMTH